VEIDTNGATRISGGNLMDIKKLEKAAEPGAFARFVAGLPQSHHHDHGGDGSIETLREAEYEGHHIVIRTTYRIEVDGKVLAVPLALGNDGQLHVHSLPNYQFASAIDMVKRLIDNFPEDFRPHRGEAKRSGGHGSHVPRKHAPRKRGKKAGK
jgi:hypothetical protein